MFIPYSQGDNSQQISVCDIPFSVIKNDKGVVQKIPDTHIKFDSKAKVLFFLGMATDFDFCSEWWAQRETMYDHSARLFFGDRLMRIRVLFDDLTEELISVIFGVNAWNYNLFYLPHEEEGLASFDAPYQEPFLSDKNAIKLKNDALHLMENTNEDAQKCTKWVFAYKINNVKNIKEIHFIKEDGKISNVAISAVTALDKDAPINSKWRMVDQDFFLGRKYYRALDAMSRRLYQYLDELPQSVEKCEIENYDGPDITFGGNGLADIFTNVYRMNMVDMAYNKIDDKGIAHTSTPGTANFGCYVGFGCFKNNTMNYSEHVWTRDIGRTLMEIINSGYPQRALPSIDYLHELLYYPSFRFKLPHWKRVANLVSEDENAIFNEGKENDGHAAIMLAIYSMYRKGYVDKAWLEAHKKELHDAADYYLWQRDNPSLSNYSDILFSESEVSTQTFGGYDVFSNILSSYALIGYAKLMRVIGENEYADKLDGMASELRAGVKKRFTMDHPRYGDVLTDTTDDAFTYEYKRMADLLIYSDICGYDMADEDPELFDLMNRTFLAQKESYYAPESGRQMGYGQGYITQQTIMLDRFKEFTDCIEASAMMCYHHTDHNYIVPEGVVMHGSKAFWYRNCDLGNAVQQAEIVKCARLIVGIDDIDGALKFVPRLPNTWSSINAKNYPVTNEDRTVERIDFSYVRSFDKSVCGKVEASDDTARYVANWSDNAKVSCIRVGPFDTDSITIKGAKEFKVKKIQDKYFAYLNV